MTAVTIIVEFETLDGAEAELDRIMLDHARRTLQEELSKGNVAIVGLSGHLAHWTVAYRITDKSVRLADSDGLKVLLRSRCSLRPTRRLYQLWPDEVIILSRREIRWRGSIREV